MFYIGLSGIGLNVRVEKKSGSSGPPDHAILDDLNSGGAGVNAEITDDLGSGGTPGNDITDP